MNKLKKYVTSILLCMVLVIGHSTNTFAQTSTGVITLASLGKSEVRLVGPSDSSTVTFRLPATWQANSSGTLTLILSTVFNSQSLPNGQSSGGGVLTVSFNRNTVAIIVLDKIESNKDYTLDIPAAFMTSVRRDGLMELRVALDSGLSCYADQQMNVIVSSASSLSFSYEEILPDTSLSNFPYPLFQDSIFPDSAYVVIPDSPSSAELQGALTIASGLSNLTSSKLALNLIKSSDLGVNNNNLSNLIFVGKASAFSQFTELNLPSPVISGKFQLEDSDYGVVQMVNSPWSRSSVLLVVSGNTDSGVVRAAHSVSTGSFVPNVSPNLAIIKNVQSTAPVSQIIFDRMLSDMGLEPKNFENSGVDSDSYTFFVPQGSTASSEAFFDLSYGHSALLNFDLSGLVVLLNGEPIGSVKFTEATSTQAINQARIVIPPALVVPGENSIEVRSSLEPIDVCVDPNFRGVWAVIWPDSRLYIPFAPVGTDLGDTINLEQYPAPLIYDSELKDTAFVLPQNDIESWRAGLQIASFLGDRANGSITKLQVFIDGEIDLESLEEYHLILVGSPNQLSILDQLASFLPVPVDVDKGIALNEFSQIQYQVPDDTPAGYVELMPSPWNPDKVVIAALGNNQQGVSLAASALFDPNLRSQLFGNFAVVNNFDVQSIDTRLLLPDSNAPSASDPIIPDQNPAASEPIATPAEVVRPNWILPALGISALLTISFVVVIVFFNRRQK